MIGGAGLLYFNSMLDFQFYTLHGLLEEAEANGQSTTPITHAR